MSLWRWTSLFAFLSCAVAGWLCYELEAFAPTSAIAAETPPSKAAPTPVETVDPKIQQMEARELELKRRQEALNDKEKILTEQVVHYEKVIREMKAKIAELEPLKENRNETLRVVYEKMESKKASQILEGMDPGEVSSLLAGMRADKAAEILGRMSVERARVVTERILGKRVPSSKSPIGDLASKDDNK